MDVLLRFGYQSAAYRSSSYRSSSYVPVKFVPVNSMVVKAYTHRETREKGKIAFGRRLCIWLVSRDAVPPHLPSPIPPPKYCA
jgi:hypothetical protein